MNHESYPHHHEQKETDPIAVYLNPFPLLAQAPWLLKIAEDLDRQTPLEKKEEENRSLKPISNLFEIFSQCPAIHPRFFLKHIFNAYFYKYFACASRVVSFFSFNHLSREKMSLVFPYFFVEKTTSPFCKSFSHETTHPPTRRSSVIFSTSSERRSEYNQSCPSFRSS